MKLHLPSLMALPVVAVAMDVLQGVVRLIAICVVAVSLYVVLPFLYLGASDSVFEGTVLSAAWWELMFADVLPGSLSTIPLYWLALTVGAAALTLLRRVRINTPLSVGAA